MSNLVERLLWHVEQVCGPLSEEVCEVAGDDDRSVLRWAFAAEVEKLEKALRQSMEGWENAVEFSVVKPQHVSAARTLASNARKALEE